MAKIIMNDAIRIYLYSLQKIQTFDGFITIETH
jgi:hypothetical protein